MLDRKRLVKTLDKIFSKYIRLRDKGICFVCGKQEEFMQCGHLFSRVAYNTRWDEENAFCVCAGCNLRHEFDFEPMRARYVSFLNQEKYDEIYQKFHSKDKLSNLALFKLLEYYRQKLKELKNDNK